MKLILHRPWAVATAVAADTPATLATTMAQIRN
jgi:hypothetical protein